LLRDALVNRIAEERGCIRIVGGMWVLYFWQDELRDGERERVKVQALFQTLRAQ